MFKENEISGSRWNGLAEKERTTRPSRDKI